MDVNAFDRLDPAGFYGKFIWNRIRPDGRTFHATRAVSVDLGVLSPRHAAASALARVGGTKVIAGITLLVGQPPDYAPSAGEIDVQVHLTPLSSNKFASGKSEQAAAIDVLVKDIIVGSRAVRLADLCIESGRSAWKVCIDLVCVAHEGNVADTAALAAVAALGALRLPDTMLGDDGAVMIKEGERWFEWHCTPLWLRHIPIPLTVCVFGAAVIADPTAAEEELVDAVLTVATMAPSGEVPGTICGLWKPGGAVVSAAQLQECLALAAAHAVRVSAMPAFAAAAA
ncbi:unnamed protein product, partial [Phaeothamnion confervicola]